MRRAIAFAFSSIITWLNPIASAIPLNVASASQPSSSSCHQLPCPNISAVGSHSHGIGNSNNDSNNNPPPRRNLALQEYEEFYRNEVERWLTKKRTAIENSVFVSYDSLGYARPSTAYAYDDFAETLYSMSVEGVGDVGEISFYVGQAEESAVRGLVNVAAFLAHAMAVSIRHDACDEFNVDATDLSRKYAISNSCGQWGRSYQDEVCDEGDETADGATASCDVDLDMTLTAADVPGGENAPPPFECRPRGESSDFTGHWDAELGVLREEYPYANRRGVMHNEGCCWWGRGVLFTRGTCNFGKLNRYLGRLAAEQGSINFFDVDFCIYPEIVCEGFDTMHLRWIVGLFEWADRVQPYENSEEGLNYMNELNTFVESGFVDVNRFIDVVGDALPYGCTDATCLAAEDQVRQYRRDNFLNLVFNVLDLPYLVDATPFPSPPPTSKPTKDSTLPPTPLPTPRSTPRPTMTAFTLPEPLSSMPTKLPTKQSGLPPATAPPTKISTARPFILQTQSPTTKSPVPETPSPADRLTDVVCFGQSTGFVPINECREYAQCVNGNVASKGSCALGLRFDSTLNACNWESSVICTAPTRRPTPRPTQQPTTLRPTEQPLVTVKPTEPPFYTFQIDASPQMPQPPSSLPPSIGSAPIPPSTMPPFDFMSNSDGQKEPPDNPLPSPKPSHGEATLIILPSSGSRGMGCNVVLSIGILCIAVAGAY